MIIDFSNKETLKTELEKGNHQALVFLVDTYHHKLCLYAYSLSNDYEGAQDIVQNVFLRLWEKRGKVKTIKSIRSFLYSCVYNEFIDQWRKDKKMLVLEEKYLEALNNIVISENEKLLTKQIELVKFEIQQLPSRCKETFLLSKQDGFTNIEIAEIMAVSVRTVESQMNKAFRILREKLKNEIKPLLFLLFGVDLTFPLPKDKSNYLMNSIEIIC